MEPIKPADIRTGMTIVDEVNESVLVIRNVFPYHLSVRVEAWSLDGYGERIEKNIMYHAEDGELWLLYHGPEMKPLS